MRQWRWACLALLLAVGGLLAGCEGEDPTGPSFHVANNTGPVTINAPIGDGSAGGSAPCAAVGTKQENGPNQPIAGSSNCATTLTIPGEAPVAEEPVEE